MADDLKKKLDRAIKLYEAAWDYHQKSHECLEEMGRLLRGDRTKVDAINALMDVFGSYWHARYRSPYSWGTDKQRMASRATLKRLLGMGFTELDLTKRIANYLKDVDESLARERHPFAWFGVRVNNYVGDGVDIENFSLSGEINEKRVAGCQHNPPCSSAAAHTDRVSDEMRRPPPA